METGITTRKRKAASQDHGELSKRLKRLTLERDGQTLHIPVELAPPSPPPKPQSSFSLPPIEDDSMQLDNTKYKVYIHNIDDELSDSESDDGRLIFLPDIEKRIRNMQIPKSILADSNGDLAGKNQQLVLYNIPCSLTLPEEKDSVRKAIIETRARARDLARMDGFRGTQTVSASSARASAGSGTTSVPTPAPLISAELGEAADAMVEDDPDAMDLS